MDQFFICLIGTFNNRELAIGIWLVGFIILCLSVPKLRTGISDLTRALLQPNLLLFFEFVAAKVAALCLALRQFGLWTTDQP